MDKKIKEVYIKPPFIKLEQFLKFTSSVSTGGQAKLIILDGLVKVNNEVCLKRGKKLFGDEIIEVSGENELFKCVISK